jgi:hypothetical protein
LSVLGLEIIQLFSVPELVLVVLCLQGRDRKRVRAHVIVMDVLEFGDTFSHAQNTLRELVLDLIETVLRERQILLRPLLEVFDLIDAGVELLLSFRVELAHGGLHLSDLLVELILQFIDC